MNEKIKKALITLLNEEVIVASWGISNMFFKEASFEFHVEGLIYQGRVVISLHDSDYRLNFDNGQRIDCSINELVNTLDTSIERDIEYTAKLEKIINGIKD